jgi:hypothetical protein
MTGAGVPGTGDGAGEGAGSVAAGADGAAVTVTVGGEVTVTVTVTAGGRPGGAEEGAGLVLAGAPGGSADAGRADAVREGGGAGDGLSATGRPRLAMTAVTWLDSAIVIVAATITIAQQASRAYQAYRYQGLSRRTIRGCLPSQKQPCHAVVG